LLNASSGFLTKPRTFRAMTTAPLHFPPGGKTCTVTEEAALARRIESLFA
jgi:hypothetical protein